MVNVYLLVVVLLLTSSSSINIISIIKILKEYKVK